MEGKKEPILRAASSSVMEELILIIWTKGEITKRIRVISEARKKTATTMVREKELSWPIHSVILAKSTKPEKTDTQIIKPLSSWIRKDLTLN